MGFVKSIAAAMAAALLTGNASAATFNLVAGGFEEGATLSLSFTAEDLDNNGQFDSDESEVTALSGSFSGNSLVPAFSFGFLDTIRLVADDTDPLILGDSEAGAVAEGLLIISSVAVVAVGPGVLELCDGIQDCATVANNANGDQTLSAQALGPAGGSAAVPLPATAWLLLSGLAAAGLATRRR